jgi:hypothetical protein
MQEDRISSQGPKQTVTLEEEEEEKKKKNVCVEERNLDLTNYAEFLATLQNINF